MIEILVETMVEVCLNMAQNIPKLPSNVDSHGP